MLTMPRVRARARPRRRVSGRAQKGRAKSKRTLGEVDLALPGCDYRQGGNDSLIEVISYQYTTSSQPSKLTRYPSAIDKRSPGSLFGPANCLRESRCYPSWQP